MVKAPNTLKNLVCSALIGGMLLSFGGVAYAVESVQSNTINETKSKNVCPYKQGKHKFNPEKMKQRVQK